MPDGDVRSRLMTEEQVADLLQVDRRAVKTERLAGRLGYSIVTGRVRIGWDDYQAYLQQQRIRRRPRGAPPLSGAALMLPTIAAPPPAALANTSPGREDGFVYFVQSGAAGPIKIGTALNIQHRLKGLQTAHYEELRLVGFRAGGLLEEQRLLKRFRLYQLKGEWHRPEPALLAFIADCNA